MSIGKIDLIDIESIALNLNKLELNDSIKNQINNSFSFLKNFSSDKIIYGINTGFGPMAQFKIDDDKLNQLQYNLIRSHSSGLGKPIDDECVRAVLVARINNFLQGFRICENLKFFIHVIPQFKFYYCLIYFSSNLKIQSYY